MPAGGWFAWPGQKFVLAGATIEPHASEADLALVRLSQNGFGRACAAGAGNFSTDENGNLNRLLSAANEFDASDLHLVAGVPPAFRVNGEIIIADEDALTEDEITVMADSLLNEQQKKKFGEEWELCISLLHNVAGRVRATFYRRNGHPEMSFRFCGDKVASREELGLPEKN